MNVVVKYDVERAKRREQWADKLGCRQNYVGKDALKTGIWSQVQRKDRCGCILWSSNGQEGTNNILLDWSHLGSRFQCQSSGGGPSYK